MGLKTWIYKKTGVNFKDRNELNLIFSFQFKYLAVIRFLMKNDLTELKEHWRAEFIKTHEPFRWILLFIALKHNKNKYLFWYRLCYFMLRHGNEKQIKAAYTINDKLMQLYANQIPLSVDIGIGLSIWHHVTGIVITPRSQIGKNCEMGSFVTIGTKSYEREGIIKIGNDVMLSSYSMIFGQNITIGNNVKVGAMSFVNKDLPDNCTVYTKKTNEMIVRNIN